MSVIMKSVLANLRTFVLTLQARNRADALASSTNPRDQVQAILDRIERAKVRLPYLVPLYRDMHAAVQQAGTGCTTGATRYAKRFEALRKLIRDKEPWYGPRYFGDEIESLQVLVPVEGVPVDAWAAASIAEVIADVKRQVAADIEVQRMLGRAAEQARVAFLASLSFEQRALLQSALAAAKARGVHAVTFNDRDLGT